MDNSFKQVSNIPSAPSEPFECAAANESSVALKEDDQETMIQQPLRPVSERRINKNNDVLVFRKSETDEFIGGTYGNNFFGGGVDQYEKPSYDDSRADAQMAHNEVAYE